MRIAVVGPTHPIKGGVSQHTTVLANRLRSTGHDVEIVSWYRQYPKRLYPGVQLVDKPEFDLFEPTRRSLAWNRPDTWIREALRLRGRDLVVFAHITPVQVPPYFLMLRVLRHFGTPTAVICHNVLPHDRSIVDRTAVAALLRSTDRVVVHSEHQLTEAEGLTSAPIAVARLAPFMPAGFVQRRPAPGEHRRLIFFGLVRPYKGVDVLMRALALGPGDVRLRIAGEFWGGTEATRGLAAELGIEDRIQIVDGYIAADQVPELFRDVDAMVLPYRTATGSQGVWTAFEFGVPVIATTAGHLADDVRVGVDGLVATPDDVPSLAAALDDFYSPGTPERMRAQVGPVDPDPYWREYLDALLGPAAREARHEPPGA
jgi:glycosyltransferase involved in cell wall biosynthesis